MTGQTEHTMWKTRWEAANGSDAVAGWCIGPALWEYISTRITCRSRTIEFGSGLSTWLFNYIGCRHTALEQSAIHFGRVMAWGGLHHAQHSRTEVLLRRIRETPASPDPWYDWTPDDDDPWYDVILIDGPPGTIGRNGVFPHIENMVGDGTIIIIDDCNREVDRELCGRIGTSLHRPVKYHDGDETTFGVITV